MNILHISHRYHVAGGSDAVFFATTDLLDQAGHRVVPFCIDDPANLPSEFSPWFAKAAGTRNIRLREAPRYFWNRDAARKLAHLINENGPFDVAHLHIYHGKHTPSILGVLRRHGIPTVHSLHEYKLACPVYTMERSGKPCDACLDGTGLKPLRFRCKSASALASAVMLAEFHVARALGDRRLIDRFICVSEFQRGVMERAGIAADKLCTLHNFVDITDPGNDPPGDYFLYFGRIEKLKGVPTLLRAAAQTGCNLVVAGDGSWSDELSRQAQSHPNIRLSGFQDRAGIAKLLRGARAVIVPSEWYENCPMSVLEAKAQGRAVIGARIGGIPELVRDNLDGLLFEPGQVDQLTSAINAMTPKRAREMGMRAREDALKRFSPGTHLARLTAQYDIAAAALENKMIRPAPHLPA